MKICINAGHAPNGNPDPGAVGQTGLRESDVTDDIAQGTMYYLQQVDYEVLVVQDDDLQAICDASNAWGADLLVSIHCNSATSREAHGTEIFTTKGETKADKLATCIMDQVSDTFPKLSVRADYDDGDVDKEENFYVLRYTDCPAVLVETAFISDLEEEALLASEQGKDDFAKAIARGITDYVSK